MDGALSVGKWCVWNRVHCASYWSVLKGTGFSELDDRR